MVIAGNIKVLLFIYLV